MNKQQLENGRENEVIGGGYFIFRRGKKTGRVGVKRNNIPFEHGSLESANTEVKRLSKIHPEEKFAIFQEVG